MQSFCPLRSIENECDKIAAIVLNKGSSQAIADPVFTKVWKDADYRACVDGGANFVYDLQQSSISHKAVEMPDLVCGDFDSIRPEVKEFYERQTNSEVVSPPERSATDFTKCILLLAEKIKKKLLDINLIIALAGVQDRCDHSAANISTLYTADKILPKNTRICLICRGSYMTLLKKGKTILDVGAGREGEWCALIPFGGPAVVTASGLKWNIDRLKLEFGGITSTSNELGCSGVVTVETDQPLIWAMSFNS